MKAPFVIIMREDLRVRLFWNEADLRNALVDLATQGAPVLALRFQPAFGCYSTLEVAEQ